MVITVTITSSSINSYRRRSLVLHSSVLTKYIINDLAASHKVNPLIIHTQIHNLINSLNMSSLTPLICFLNTNFPRHKCNLLRVLGKMTTSQHRLVVVTLHPQGNLWESPADIEPLLQN
ncbi:hypothetical protein J3459_017481 [Metarhizium acridum]|nr:hypothetical protein J3459_017481 [Metarhizium acridum]